MPGYIVVTPAKNEADRLPKLIRSITFQSVKPILWVIVDDESTDGTVSLLKQTQSRHRFIRVISSKERRIRPDLDRYGIIVKRGIDFAIQQCKENHVKPDYIAIVDADMILEKEYFRKLIDAFEHNPKLGIVSGAIFDRYKNKLILRRNLDNKPIFTAAAMMFSKKCYEEIGGFPATVGPENVAVIKAINRNWEVKCISDARGVHTRPLPASIADKWRKFSKSGETYYRLKYHPINAMLTGIYFTFCGPYGSGPSIAGPAYLFGYVKSFLSGRENVQDPEVLNYFWNSWNRLLTSIINKILVHTRFKKR